MALTAVRAAALPGQTEVYALSSGEALAWAWIVHGQAKRVGVVGDARRGAFWLGLFERQHEAPICVEDWRLVAPERLAAAVGSDALLVTSDLERVTALWEAQPPRAGSMPAFTAAMPQARHLGACALHRIGEGIPSEALEPLYMHPAADPPKVHASG
jgi:tRNA A37 threonylcarbamoyladenosine modification protein TsaB